MPYGLPPHFCNEECLAIIADDNLNAGIGDGWAVLQALSSQVSAARADRDEDPDAFDAAYLAFLRYGVEQCELYFDLAVQAAEHYGMADNGLKDAGIAAVTRAWFQRNLAAIEADL